MAFNKILNLALIILFIASASTAFAETDVPASLQVALFYKIFDFDNTLSEIPGQEIVIGIFYEPDNPQSKLSEEEIKDNFSRLSGRKINDKSVVIKDITNVEQLHGLDIVYVTPGTDSSISQIVEKCHINKILSISGVEEYAHEGLAITIGLRDQKPRIIINKTSADLSGAKLSSKILSLAEIL